MLGLRGTLRPSIPLLAAIAVAALALAGCSQVPVATTYPAEQQKKMQSAYHWKWLARDLTERVKAQRAADETLAAKPIYVRPQAVDTPFNRNFHSFLVTELLNAQVPVALEPEGANQLAYTTQIVAHKQDLWNRPTPGAITGLTAALLIPVSAASDGMAAAGYGALGIAAAGAVDAGIGGVAVPTSTELIFTASIWDEDVLRFRKAETFYINPRDYPHYEEVPVVNKPADIVY